MNGKLAKLNGEQWTEVQLVWIRIYAHQSSASNMPVATRFVFATAANRQFSWNRFLTKSAQF